MQPQTNDPANVSAARIEHGIAREFSSLISSTSISKSAPDAQSLKQQQAVEDYAAIITSQFVGAVLEQQSGIMGENEYASQHYHTMMVNAVSEQLSRTDAFGLKAMIEQEVGKW
ncbi:MAG: hypothetical protein AAF412_14675 [Pseudomonadota bacterium]